MNRLEKQIKSYEEQLRNMSLKDDYDEGQAAQLRQVIDDLKKLESLPETGISAQLRQCLAQRNWYKKGLHKFKDEK